MSVCPPKPGPKPGQVRVVRALYNYTAQQPDELSFKGGDLLYVFDQVTDKNWWKARCGNRTGVIPSNYVEYQTEMVETPLHDAARRGNMNFLQECLKQGVSPTGLDSVGNTPLYWACSGGHIDCVMELLEQSNPPINAKNKVGDTPLHAAAAHDHVDVVKLLVEKGANFDIKNMYNETPADLGSSAITNALRLSRTASNRLATYSPEEYADDSD